MLAVFESAMTADPHRHRSEPETHAVSIAIGTALGRRPHFQILDTDYDTRDGSCVRDFVHVLDLADVHTRAIEHRPKSRNRPWDNRKGIA